MAFLRAAELAGRIVAVMNDLPTDLRERRQRLSALVSELARKDSGIKRIDITGELGWLSYEVVDVAMTTEDARSLLAASGEPAPAGEFAGLCSAMWINTFRTGTFGSHIEWTSTVVDGLAVRPAHRRALEDAFGLIDLSLRSRGSLPDGGRADVHLLLMELATCVCRCLGIARPTATELALIAVAAGTERPGQDHAVLVDRWRKRLGRTS